LPIKSIKNHFGVIYRGLGLIWCYIEVWCYTWCDFSFCIN